jgi:hypothetical protein
MQIEGAYITEVIKLKEYVEHTMTVETLVQAPDRSFPYRPIN